MPRIIFISPHFKSGKNSAAHLSYLVHYIATREGVAPVDDAEKMKPATKQQEQLIRRLVRDFPMTKKRFEYEDYLTAPTRENAADFIGIALEQNLDQLGKRENYVDYIGMRPGVAKLDSHGLFDGTGRKLIVSQVQKEISEHPGVVWTPVISLRREDAHAMGLESPESWRASLSACAAELARGYKINPAHLKWYAAFHDNSHHPHVHMILYSTDPTEGFLTKQGITQIKSTLARQLFPKQLQELYAADTQRRDALKEDARKRYQELIDRMAAGSVQNERIEKLTAALAKRLSTHKGKLQYGYLQAPAKAIVDAIVDELARDVRVAEAYRLWFEIRTDILSTYQDSVPELPPLSKQKEFKPIKNMVIAEAAKLIEQSFTDEIIVPIETGDSAKQEAPDAESKSSPYREGQQTTTTPPPPERAGETLSVAQSATRLLHHLSRVFQDNTPPRCDSGMRMDKKLRRKLREKKIAQGHKPDDHEDTMNMTM